jgi:hypothetical protein
LHVPFSRIHFSIPRRRRGVFGRRFETGTELSAVLAAAEGLPASRANHKGKLLPVLTSEVVLLALARSQGIPLGDELRRSGLRIRKLEIAVKLAAFRHSQTHLL